MDVDIRVGDLYEEKTRDQVNYYIIKKIYHDEDGQHMVEINYIEDDRDKQHLFSTIENCIHEDGDLLISRINGDKQ